MKTTIIVSCLALFAAAPLSAALNVDDTETRNEATETATERFERLQSDSQKAYREWVKEIRKKMADAEAKGEELPESEFTPPLGPFVEEAKKAAEEYAGTEDAVQFHIWLIETGGNFERDVAISSLRTLVKDHAASEAIEPLCGMFEYFSQLVDEDEATEMLKKLEKESKSTKVQGFAAFARLSSVIDNAAFDSPEFASAKKEIMDVLERVGDKRLKSSVEQKLKVRETFSLGMVAPDIIGTDLDGVDFKLSDYKGNVVFVDFWGDW